jgi:hypothetical protein
MAAAGPGAKLISSAARAVRAAGWLGACHPASAQPHGEIQTMVYLHAGRSAGRRHLLHRARPLLAACLALASLATLAQPLHGARCLRDRLGDPVCAPPQGGIAKDLLGEIVCGPGECRKDSLGQIVCSAQPGGAVSTNRLRQVVCTGGCQLASAAACQRPDQTLNSDAPSN